MAGNPLGDGEVNYGKVTLQDLLTPLLDKLTHDWQYLLSPKFHQQLVSQGYLPALLTQVEEGNYIIHILLILLTLILLTLISRTLLGTSSSSSPPSSSPKHHGKNKDVGEEDKMIPRDFTPEQLRDFDGIKEKKIFIALKGDVYDVTPSSEFYGAEGAYHCFAGRNASRAMAKLSFDEAELSNPNLTDLGPFEKDTLESWVEKFKYVKQYEIVGKLSTPITNRTFTPSELSEYKGSQTPSAGRVDSEILIGLNGSVYDVSYGGKEMYGTGGPYAMFAGRDASRCLAKMSFKEEDLNSRDLSDLTSSELNILREWEDKFRNKKKYPCVGVLVSETGNNASGVGNAGSGRGRSGSKSKAAAAPPKQ